jgi:hypothetical protein
MTTNGKAVDWEIIDGNRAKPEDLLEEVITQGKAAVDDFAADIERAVNKSMAIREAETFGAPGKAGLKVRREGLLRRKNPEDEKRYEALKANYDRAVLSARHISNLGGFAANGEQFVLDVVTHLTEVTNALPDEVQPVGEVLTKATTKILSASYVESLQLNAEMGFQEIAQATRPRQQQDQQ